MPQPRLEPDHPGPSIAVPLNLFICLVIDLERQKYLLRYSDPALRLEDQAHIDKTLKLSKDFLGDLHRV